MATIEDFEAMSQRVSNWGRWGGDDELGTLNHITPERVRRAAGLVRRGAVFPLTIALDDRGPFKGGALRGNPTHLMVVDGGDAHDLRARTAGLATDGAAAMRGVHEQDLFRFNEDWIAMPLQAGTQWDALAHAYYDDQLYNGFPASSVTSLGASRCGIDKVDAKGIVARGVLLDVARARDAAVLDGAAPIEPEELDAVALAQGVEVDAGDVVLVRTGWWRSFAVGTAPPSGGGLGWRAAGWLHDHDVAAIAADNLTVEATDQDIPVRLPLHLLCLRDMGLLLGELWDLEALAADCADDGCYEFQLVAAPLRVTGAVGSPTTPLAVK